MEPIRRNCSRRGKEAPKWLPDAASQICLKCSSQFTFFRRRHHCRACGKVLCSTCCHLRIMLQYLAFQKDRVCDDCYKEITRGFIKNPICRNDGGPGRVIPQWLPDAATEACMNCNSRFTFFHRRHHCRACGKKSFENQLESFVENIWYIYAGSFRKDHAFQTTPLRLLQHWKKALDYNKHVVAALMDLSKAFGRLPHDILNLGAYRMSNASIFCSRCCSMWSRLPCLAFHEVRVCVECYAKISRGC